MKVAAGIFKNGNRVLLMRRAQSQPLGGAWEYPGGKFEYGESGPDCLRRELREELGIDATIGKLITVAKMKIKPDKELELYAYEVLSYTGDITPTVHDGQEWVTLPDLESHPQLPADLMVSRVLASI